MAKTMFITAILLFFIFTFCVVWFMGEDDEDNS